MTPAATEPLTRETILQFLAQLTDEQKRYVLLKLLPPFMASLTHTAVVYDAHGRQLGDLVPVRPVPPGTKVGMSDEARAALAGKSVTRPQPEVWRALVERTRNATGGEGR